MNANMEDIKRKVNILSNDRNSTGGEGYKVVVTDGVAG